MKDNEKMLTLPARTGKLIAKTDVLVVGGGTSGIGAAIGAAEAGASVFLAERYGFLGGHSTAALTITIGSYHTSPTLPQTSSKLALFPTDHGPGHPVVAGVLAKLVEKLVKAGGALPPSPETGFIVPVDPEILKIVALEMVQAVGVELLLHAFASSIITDESEMGVVFESKSGPVVVKAKVIVDCTGDGDVAALAGAHYEFGREEDSIAQPMSLLFIMDGFDRERFFEYVKQNPDQWSGVQGLNRLVEEATAKGDLTLPRENILFFGTSRKHQVSINSTRITNLKGTDVQDLTRAEVEGRRQMAQITAFLQKYVPGFENAYISQSGATVGVRETRRVIGEYKLTADDVLGAHSFKDVIAHGTYPEDLHNPKGKGTVLKKLPAGKAYDIPLRCLIPLKVDNLLVAGRCISGTHEAQSSYRVIPISMATGQAAGVCAAIAAKQNRTPRTVSFQEVQNELRRQGAIV